jgi:hypothetical protein
LFPENRQYHTFQISVISLGRIIYDGSSRNGGAARDKREERDLRDVRAQFLQSRFSRPSRLSQVSAIVAEVFMNHAG